MAAQRQRRRRVRRTLDRAGVQRQGARADPHSVRGRVRRHDRVLEVERLSREPRIGRGARLASNRQRQSRSAGDRDGDVEGDARLDALARAVAVAADRRARERYRRDSRRRGGAARDLVGGRRRDRVTAQAQVRGGAGRAQDGAAVQGQGASADADPVRVRIPTLDDVPEAQRLARRAVQGGLARIGADRQLQLGAARDADRHQGAELNLHVDRFPGPVGVATGRGADDPCLADGRRGRRGAVHFVARVGSPGVGAQAETRGGTGSVGDRPGVEGQRPRADADPVRVHVRGLHDVAEPDRGRRHALLDGGPRVGPDRQRQAGLARDADGVVELHLHLHHFSGAVAVARNRAADEPQPRNRGDVDRSRPGFAWRARPVGIVGPQLELVCDAVRQAAYRMRGRGCVASRDRGPAVAGVGHACGDMANFVVRDVGIVRIGPSENNLAVAGRGA